MQGTRIGLTLSEKELEMVKAAAAKMSLKPSTFCKMVVMQEVTKDVKESAKSN